MDINLIYFILAQLLYSNYYIYMIEITDAQAEYIIENNKIPDEILSSSEKVAVIFTQNWCPQWPAMKKWLPQVTDKVQVFYICYNLKNYSYKIMKVKESIFENDLIPYVRYYKDGQLLGDSNYVEKESFLSAFN